MEKSTQEQRDELIEEAIKLSTKIDKEGYNKEDVDRLKDINTLLKNIYVTHGPRVLG